MNEQSSDNMFDPMGQIPFEEEAKAYRDLLT